MLNPDPADRYQSMADVVEDLTRHASHRPLKFAPERSLNEQLRKWTRRHPRLASATGVLCGAAVVFSLLVAAIVVRGHQMARQEALTQLDHVRHRVPEMRALTSSISANDRQTLAAGLTLAEQVLETYGILGSPEWKSRAHYTYLSGNDRSELEQALIHALYSSAAAHLLLSVTESDVARRTNHLVAAKQANDAAMLLDDERHVLPALGMQGDQIGLALAAKSHADSRSSWQIQPVPIEQAADFLGACALLESRQYEAAIETLEKIRSAEPYDVSVWFMLGQGAWCPGPPGGCGGLFLGLRFTVASVVPRIPSSRALPPGCPTTQGSGRRLYGLPRSPRRLHSSADNRAVAYRELADYDAAVADLSRAIELNAPQTRIYLLRAEILERLGDKRGAAADRQLGLSLSPADEQSCIARGRARLRSSPEQALKDFELATQWNPKSYTAWRNIAHVYAERLNRPQDAIGVLDKLLTWSDHAMNDLVSRGVIYARMGKREEAHLRCAACVATFTVRQRALSAWLRLFTDFVRRKPGH